MKHVAYNPVLPGYEYVPDVEPRVFGNRLYLYGSHDRFDGEDYCLNDYVCWSAPLEDVGNWHYEGVIWQAAKDPANADGEQKLFAPDCVQGKDGRFYLYYCLNRSSAVSVAVCDTPAGQYEFYGHVHHGDGAVYGSRPRDPFQFDPGVLRDEDGRIFLYTGFAHKPGQLYEMMKKYGFLVDGCYCVELEDDMLTVKSDPVLAAPGQQAAADFSRPGFEGHAFYEAASPRKINGKYYLFYSSEESHELCYATADAPDVPFAYGGVVVSNGDVGLEGAESVEKAHNYTGNNHGGMVELGDQWYIFYHRMTNRNQFSRQCCAEPVEILPDGKILQAEVTSCGLNGGPLPAVGEYSAGMACNLSGAGGTCFYAPRTSGEKVKEEHPYLTQENGDDSCEESQYIANLRNHAWAGFRYFAFTGQEKEIVVTMRGGASGKLLFSTDRGKETVAVLEVEPSEGWTSAGTVLKVSAGKLPLYMVFEGKGALNVKGFTVR